jgi:hypothetical protein
LFVLKFMGASTPSLLVQQRGDADVDGVPERGRPVRLQLGPQDLHQLVVIGREVARIDLNAIREAADARLVDRLHRRDELFGCLLDQFEIRAHAAAPVEQHHHGNRLDLVGEQRDLLTLAVVVDLEDRALEIGYETTGAVRHGGVNGDRPDGGAEGRLLLLGEQSGRQNAGETEDSGDNECAMSVPRHRMCAGRSWRLRC